MKRTTVTSADTTVVPGSQRCAGCPRVKPLDQFRVAVKPNGRTYRDKLCKVCRRQYDAEWDRTKRKPLTAEKHKRRRELIRIAEAKPKRQAAKKAYGKAYGKTLLGRLMRQRQNVRWRLKKRESERLLAAEAGLTREIERLRREKEDE